MKVMVTLIVIGVLGTILKGLEKGMEKLEIRGRIKAIQIICPGDLKKLAFTQTREKPPVETDVKNLQGEKKW